MFGFDGSMSVYSPSPHPPPGNPNQSLEPGFWPDHERMQPLSWVPPVIRSGASSPTSSEATKDGRTSSRSVGG